MIELTNVVFLLLLFVFGVCVGLEHSRVRHEEKGLGPLLSEEGQRYVGWTLIVVLLVNTAFNVGLTW